MPAPDHPSRYPVEFHTLFQRAQAGETIEVPSTNPQSLRARLYGFARALRKHKQEELADSVQIGIRGTSVVVESRSNSLAAKEVTAALATLGENPADQLFDKLAK